MYIIAQSRRCPSERSIAFHSTYEPVRLISVLENAVLRTVFEAIACEEFYSVTCIHGDWQMSSATLTTPCY